MLFYEIISIFQEYQNDDSNFVNNSTSMNLAFQIVFKNKKNVNKIEINQKRIICNSVKVLDFYKNFQNDFPFFILKRRFESSSSIKGTFLLDWNNQVNIESLYREISIKFDKEFHLLYKDHGAKLFFYFNQNIGEGIYEGFREILSNLKIDSRSLSFQNYSNKTWIIKEANSSFLKNRVGPKSISNFFNSSGLDDNIELCCIPLNPLNNLGNSRHLMIPFHVENKNYIIGILFERIISKREFFDKYDFSVKLFRSKYTFYCDLNFYFWGSNRGFLDFSLEIKKNFNIMQPSKTDYDPKFSIDSVGLKGTTMANLIIKCKLKLLKKLPIVNHTTDIPYETLDHHLKVISRSNQSILAIKNISSWAISLSKVDILESSGIFEMLGKFYYNKTGILRIGSFYSSIIDRHIFFIDYILPCCQFHELELIRNLFPNIKFEHYKQLSPKDLKGNLEIFLNDFKK